MAFYMKERLILTTFGDLHIGQDFLFVEDLEEYCYSIDGFVLSKKANYYTTGFFENRKKVVGYIEPGGDFLNFENENAPVVYFPPEPEPDYGRCPGC